MRGMFVFDTGKAPGARAWRVGQGIRAGRRRKRARETIASQAVQNAGAPQMRDRPLPFGANVNGRPTGRRMKRPRRMGGFESTAIAAIEYTPAPAFAPGGRRERERAGAGGGEAGRCGRQPGGRRGRQPPRAQ